MPTPTGGPVPAATLKLTALLACLVAFGPISTDLYLASLPDLGRYFAASVADVQNTLSVFLLGFAGAMLIYGPLSDRFGRRPVILGGVIVFMIGSAACMVAPDIHMLTAARFLQAVGACSGAVVARAVVRDVYPRDQAAKVMAYMGSAMAIAPFAAPIIGGWIHTLWGWRANFAVLVIFGALLFVWVWRVLKETNSHPDADALSPLAMLANYRTLAGDRVVVGYVLTVAFAYAAMFTFVSASSFVLIEVMGLPAHYFGFGFAAVISGYIAGGLLSGRLTQRLGIKRMVGLGSAACAVIGVMGAGLAWAGIQTLAAVLLPLVAFFLTAAFVIPNGGIGAISPHPRIAGSASALLGFIQMGAGAVMGWMHSLAFDHSTRALASLVGVCGLGCLVSYWVMLHRVERG